MSIHLTRPAAPALLRFRLLAPPLALVGDTDGNETPCERRRPAGKGEAPVSFLCPALAVPAAARWTLWMWWCGEQGANIGAARGSRGTP